MKFSSPNIMSTSLNIAKTREKMKYFKIIVIIYLICEMASASALNSKMEQRSKESRHVGIVEDFLGLNEESEFGLQTGLPVNHNIPPPNKEKTLKATKPKTHILAHKKPGEKKPVAVKPKVVKPVAHKKPAATKKIAKPKKANEKLAKHDKPDRPEKPDKRHPQKKKVAAVPKGKAVIKKAAAPKKKADPKKAATQKPKAVPKKAAAPKAKVVPKKAAPTKKTEPKKAVVPKAVPLDELALKSNAAPRKAAVAKPVVLKSNTKTTAKPEITLVVKV